MSDKKVEKKKVVNTKVASDATKKKAVAKTNSGTKKVSTKKTTSTTKKNIPNKAKVVKKTEPKKTEVVPKEPIVKEEITNEVKTEKVEKVEKKVEIKTDEPKTQSKTTITIIIVIIAIILISAYVYSWYHVKNQEKLASSYLLSSTTISLEIKNLEEVNQILKEAPNEYFVLISYTKSEDTYELEKGLKEIIDTYTLADRFYYLDVTDIMQEDNYLERINNAFNTDVITKVPIILYYKDGVIADSGVVLRDDDNPINAGDFQKLLDIYGYEEEGL